MPTPIHSLTLPNAFQCCSVCRHMTFDHYCMHCHSNDLQHGASQTGQTPLHLNTADWDTATEDNEPSDTDDISNPFWCPECLEVTAWVADIYCTHAQYATVGSQGDLQEEHTGDCDGPNEAPTDYNWQCRDCNRDIPYLSVMDAHTEGYL